MSAVPANDAPAKDADKARVGYGIALMVAGVMCVVRFNVMVILGSLALAGLASFGPGLVSGMFSAVI